MKPLLGDMFRLASCRAHAVCEPDGGVVDRAALELAGWFGRLFDGPPRRGEPAGAMAGTVTLCSEDRTWQLELAEQRTALTWNRPGTDAPAPTVPEFFARAAEILGDITTWRRTRAHQLAAVVERIGVHPTPGLAMAQRLFSPALASLIESPRAIVLETQERRKLGRFDVHSSQRFRSGVKLGDGEKALLAQHEVATPPQQTLADFKPASIRAFLEAAREHIGAAFDQLYPP